MPLCMPIPSLCISTSCAGCPPEEDGVMLLKKNPAAEYFSIWENGTLHPARSSPLPILIPSQTKNMSIAANADTSIDISALRIQQYTLAASNSLHILYATYPIISAIMAAPAAACLFSNSFKGISPFDKFRNSLIQCLYCS